jgi:hypothetical protein
LKHPNIGIEFRGSLIDEKMFAIDVMEWNKRNILEEHRWKAVSIKPDSEEAA